MTNVNPDMLSLRTEYAQKLIIEVLKAGCIYERLLSDFERTFVTEVGLRYARYGNRIVVTDEQLGVFSEVGKKLNLNSYKESVCEY